MREYLHHVNFKKEFAAPPKIFLGLSAEDVLCNEDHSLFVESRNVTIVTKSSLFKKGFDIAFIARGSCHVWSACASYVAFDSGLAGLEKTHMETGVKTCNNATWGWGLAKGKGKRSFSAPIQFESGSTCLIASFQEAPNCCCRFGWFRCPQQRRPQNQRPTNQHYRAKLLPDLRDME